MKKPIIHDPHLIFRNPLFPLDSITHLVIHHTEEFGWDVHRTHHHHINKNGWDGIGYNFFIEYDGSIQLGRGIHIGAHAYGHNSDSIGICISGHYDVEVLSPVMRDSLYQLSLYLMKEYNLSYQDVYGHRECDSDKTCPGTNIDMDEIRFDLSRLMK